MAEDRDFVLGRGITKLARGRENRTSSVVSIRLSGEEMDMLSTLAERRGKNFSQVIREAIGQMRSTEESEIGVGGVLSLTTGASFTFGDRGALPRSVMSGITETTYTS